MINIVFSKMEAYSGNFGLTLSQLQHRNSLLHQKSGSIEDGDLSMKGSDKSLHLKKVVEEEKTIKNDSSMQQLSIQSNVTINFSAVDQYVF